MLAMNVIKYFDRVVCFEILAMYVIKYFDLVVCFEKIMDIFFLSKVRGHRNLSKIFYRHFFKFLAMNVIKYFDLVVCFEKIIKF